MGREISKKKRDQPWTARSREAAAKQRQTARYVLSPGAASGAQFATTRDVVTLRFRFTGIGQPCRDRGKGSGPGERCLACDRDSVRVHKCGHCAEDHLACCLCGATYELVPEIMAPT